MSDISHQSLCFKIPKSYPENMKTENGLLEAKELSFDTMYESVQKAHKFVTSPPYWTKKEMEQYLKVSAGLKSAIIEKIWYRSYNEQLYQKLSSCSTRTPGGDIFYKNL